MLLRLIAGLQALQQFFVAILLDNKWATVDIMIVTQQIGSCAT